MPEPLNILFTSSWYPSKVHPTLGNFVQRHAEAVASMHHVHVLYISAEKHHSGGFHIEDSHSGNLRTTIVYYRKGPSRVWIRWNAFRAGMRHIRLNHRADFDLVHHHVTWPEAWEGVIIRKQLRIPLVLTEHWTGYLREVRGQLPIKVRLFSAWIARYCSVICPVTEHLGENMRSYGMKGRYSVVPNAVDTSLFILSAKSAATPQFLHVSSLKDAHKNVSGILRAFRKALESNPDLHLSVGGDGAIEPYQSLATELAIPSERITFFGEQSWSGVAQRMNDAHCLVLFSNYENLPCVVVEALASGLRILSTDVGGISEHISPERGTLIPAHDEEALAQAFIAESKKINETERGSLRRYAEEHFSIPAVARSFDEIYRQVITQHSGRPI